MKSNYLPNVPAESDAFGNHQRLADAIARIIHERDEGCAIGLLGPWGSGKSTIIGFLKKNLEKAASSSNRTRCNVFLFDAWIHQGDPLRRSFLYELVGFLRSINVFDTDEATSIQSRIKSQPLTLRSTHKPVVTGWGIAAGLSTLVSAVGLKILPDEFFWWGFQDYIRNLLPLTLILSPLWVFILAKAYRFVRQHLSNGGGGKLHAKDDLAGLFFFKTQTVDQTLVLEQGDQTTIEFRETFQEIIKKAAGAGKLIIVIDNIDRLDPAEARDAWATMQTFFGSQTGINPQLSNNYFLVVPFAAESVNRLVRPFFDIHTLAHGHDSDGGVITDLGKESISGLSRDIVEKSFEIVFSVSPPIMTKWRDFFVACLDVAFPELNQSDRNKITNLFSNNPDPSSTRGPREIKQFVNQIVSIYREREDDFTIFLYATYVKYQKHISENPDALRNGTLLTAYEKDLVANSDWQTEIAAIHFGTDKETAEQLLLSEPITKCLQSGEGKKLPELANIPGFDDVLHGILSNESMRWAPHHGDNFINVVKALGALEQANQNKYDIWEKPRQKVKQISRWGTKHFGIANCFQTIIHNTDDDKIPGLLRDLRVCLSSFEPMDLSNTDGKGRGFRDDSSGWKDAAKVVISAESDDTISTIHVPNDQLFCTGLLYSVVEDEEAASLSRRFEFVTEKVDLKDQVISDVREGIVVSGFSRLSQIPYVSEDKEMLGALSQTVYARLKSTDNIEIRQVVELAEFLAIANTEVQQTDIQNFCNEVGKLGYLAHYIHETSNALTDFSRLALAFLCVNPRVDQNGQQWNSGNGINLINAFLGSPDSDNDRTKNFIGVALSSPLLATFCNVIISNSNLFEIGTRLFAAATERKVPIAVSSEQVFDGNGFFENHLDENTFSKILGEPSLSRKVVEYITSSDFELARVNLYLRIAQTLSREYMEQFSSKLCTTFNSFPKGDWYAAILGTDISATRSIELAAQVNEFKKVELKQQASEALGDVCAWVLEQSSLPTEVVNRTNTLFSLLSPSHRTNTAADVLDRVLSENQAQKIYLSLVCFFDLIASTEVLATESSRFVRKVLTPLAMSDDEAHVLKAVNIVQKFPQVTKKAGNDYKRVFKDAVDAKIRDENTSENIRLKLEELKKST